MGISKRLCLSILFIHLDRRRDSHPLVPPFHDVVEEPTIEMIPDQCRERIESSLAGRRSLFGYGFPPPPDSQCVEKFAAEVGRIKETVDVGS